MQKCSTLQNIKIMLFRSMPTISYLIQAGLDASLHQERLSLHLNLLTITELRNRLSPETAHQRHTVCSFFLLVRASTVLFAGIVPLQLFGYLCGKLIAALLQDF